MEAKCPEWSANHTDHFSFLPTRWIEKFNVPQVGVEIRTVSSLRYCGESRRRLQQEESASPLFSSAKVQLTTPVSAIGPGDVVVITSEDPLFTSKTMANVFFVTTVVLALVVAALLKKTNQNVFYNPMTF